MNLKSKGKFLSLILRHKPEVINIQLDENGWANVQDIVDSGEFTFELIDEIVRVNNKKRYAFNKDKTKIRALQGHSVEVDLQLEEKSPHYILYHGTSRKNLQSILENQYIHLLQLYEHSS